MVTEDLMYFRQRADAEIERAQQSPSQCAAEAHRRLAEAYLQKLAVLSPRERSELDGGASD